MKDSGAAHSLLCAMDKPEGRLDRVGAINLATPETGELGDGDHFSAIAMRNSGIRPRPLDVGNLNRGLLGTCLNTGTGTYMLTPVKQGAALKVDKKNQ